MKKRVSLSAVALSLCLFPAHAGNVYWDSLVFLYDTYFGKEMDWVIDESGAIPRMPSWYKKYYQETDKFVESGTFGWEPTIEEIAFGYSRYDWSEKHKDVCSNTSAYKEMPITTAASGYDTHYSFMSGKSSQVKRITVSQNVPFTFKAKTHGGLTDLLSDSYYFWSFGDGIRRFNKKGDDESASHTYMRLGEYSLSSIVYSEEWSIGISVGTSLNGDFSVNDSKVSGKLESHGKLYLEGCDFAIVNVVPNNAPKASIAYQGPHTAGITMVGFHGSISSDPDGHPLTYTWRLGTKVMANTATFKLPLGAFYNLRKQYSGISLTVSDGDKSDTTTLSFANL